MQPRREGETTENGRRSVRLWEILRQIGGHYCRGFISLSVSYILISRYRLWFNPRNSHHYLILSPWSYLLFIHLLSSSVQSIVPLESLLSRLESSFLCLRLRACHISASTSSLIYHLSHPLSIIHPLPLCCSGNLYPRQGCHAPLWEGISGLVLRLGSLGCVAYPSVRIGCTMFPLLMVLSICPSLG